MPAADFAGVVRFALNPATSPFTITDGIYQTPTLSESVRGVIHQRSKVAADGSGLDDETAVLTMEKALFSTITEWTPNDRFTVAGEVPWQVRASQEHEAHLTLSLGRRIQRGNELAPTPLSIFGSRCVLWLDASDAATITSDANGVSAWADKSTAGLVASLVQSVNANKPNVDPISFNGLDSLLFVAANSEILTRLAATPVTGPPFRVFVACARVGGAGTMSPFAMSDGLAVFRQYWVYQNGIGNARWSADAGATADAVAAASIPAGSMALVMGHEILANSRAVQLDGANDGANATAAAVTVVDTSSGGLPGGSQFWDGHVGEIVVVEESVTPISVAELTAIETYFERWDITIP